MLGVASRRLALYASDMWLRLNLHASGTLLLGAALFGCASSEEQWDIGGPELGLIAFTPMFSAFDGLHEYAVTPSVPSAAANSKDTDPVLASTVKWEVDGAFVKQSEFSDLPAAIKLTTKRAGTTKVSVTVKTLSGKSASSSAKLSISMATPEEWAAGEPRYNSDMPTTWGAAEGETICGLAAAVELPKTSACANCHSPSGSMFAVEPTPTQTAGYSNEDLVNIFTQGAKPAGGVFNSPFLRSVPMPACTYRAFHTREMSDEEKNGIIWHLRSIAPKSSDD